MRELWLDRLAAADTRIAVREMPLTPSVDFQQEHFALTPEQKMEAARRFQIIQPLVAARNASVTGKPLVLDDHQFQTVDEVARYLAKQHGLSRATIFRWDRRFRDGGYGALADEPREDCGISRAFADRTEAASFVQGKYLREGLSVRLTYEALLREWNVLCDDGEAPPCYRTVLNYVNSIPPALKIYARDGERAFDTKCQPILVRDFNLLPNDLWVSDHGKHDVWVRNDCFPGMAPDAPVRPWLTAFMDMRSRKVVGYVWNATPSSLTIGSALRMAILTHGIPKQVYIDNGKDYEKVGKIGVNPDTDGVFVRLGIDPQYCLPKHPQSKNIESWFSTVRKRFDSKFRPFYCGSSPANRPEECSKALIEHKRYMDGKVNSSPLMPASEFIAMARVYIAEEYNLEYDGHSGKGMKNRTPGQVFDEELPAGRRTYPAAEVLDHLLWERKPRKIIEGGVALINSERYEPVAARDTAAMFDFIGREIVIAYDPLNMGEAVALDPSTSKPIARLQAQKLLQHGPTSHEHVKASMRHRRLIARAVNGYVAHIGASYESELDVMRRRAGLPAASELNETPQTEERIAPRRALAAARGLRIDRREIGNYFADSTAPQFVEDVAEDILSEKE